MATVTRRVAWQQPAILGYGFRPFFLFGALHAALAIVLWVPWFLGLKAVATTLPPVAWHAHSLLFGYVPAVIAGFLLTAIPNWTGRPPLVGWPLAALVSLWLAGRLAVIVPASLGPWSAALLDLTFLAALTAIAAREVVSARNWRNVKVLVLLAILLFAQGLFHWEVERFGRPEMSDRLAIGTVLTLITLIGGRIVPSFTSNWIRRSNPGPLPRPPGTFDTLATTAGIVALGTWIATAQMNVPGWAGGGILVLAGLLHLVRQARWAPHRTLREPLVAILHAAYFFVPLGYILTGAAELSHGHIAASAGIHAWTTGAIGTMTLAVMTRASLGHTGRPLAATRTTIAIYGAVLLAALLRIASALAPHLTLLLLPAAGIAWIVAFAAFAAAYGPMLLRRRRDTPASP
ncbi:MAG: NnrS family protein [Hyphomicrobiaceae bacterium]|nr:MAG: NnrS family protein [Hyphomicrobiaceae bacterium]